jgi:aspartyl-tRNA(Asn)/glutamyl-tRNA(Gln) amidotransferase subunit C
MLAFAMPVVFTRAEIEALAALANLELEAEEVDLFRTQLSDILDYARQVQQIDTTGVPPTASVADDHEAARPDAVQPSLDRADALANAPDASPDGGLFRVPRVIG